MKLATLKVEGVHDGRLLVVDKELKFIAVPYVPKTLQWIFDHWAEDFPVTERIYKNLDRLHLLDSITFDPTTLASPLPRAYQWLDCSAYLSHVERVRKARGAELPESFLTDPLMYQGASDDFCGPRDPILVADESWGIDFESEVAVIVDRVPMGVTPKEAEEHIKLIMLVNDVSLRNLIPSELAKGFGFIHGKPATAFSPVAVTPDELGDAWRGNKVHLPLTTYLNGELFGEPDAGVDMQFDFSELIAHAAKTRNLGAGTIIGSGTVSNRDPSRGYSCLAEKRVVEVVDVGEAQTPFMHFGDTVKIEMLDRNGESIFGAIEQTVEQFES